MFTLTESTSCKRERVIRSYLSKWITEGTWILWNFCEFSGAIYCLKMTSQKKNVVELKLICHVVSKNWVFFDSALWESTTITNLFLKKLKMNFWKINFFLLPAGIKNKNILQFSRRLPENPILRNEKVPTVALQWVPTTTDAGDTSTTTIFLFF